MKHIVAKDADGHLVYDGLLSPQEKATIDDILNALKKEIPQIEADLKSLYGNGVLYKYHLGLFLGDLLKRYNISISEQRKFWDEIKTFATKEDRKRNEGTNAVTRSFYQQCYVLSQQDVEVVEKLTWRQWQDILDRVGNRADERIFLWIKKYPNKIHEDEWRKFEKALHLYLKNIDTSVFDNDELFSIYDSIMLMCQTWIETFKNFAIKNPKSAKIKNQGSWEKKYYTKCYSIKKEKRSQVITKEICNDAFSALMDN